MPEWVTEAIILKIEERGEKDTTLEILTPKTGRIKTRVISGKKSTSKLMPHLQVGNITNLRITEGKTQTITDALEKRKETPNNQSCLRDLLETCFFLEHMIKDKAENVDVYETARERVRDGKKPNAVLLKKLGYDPQNAFCYLCRKKEWQAFNVLNQAFVCGSCLREKKEVREWSVEVEK